MARRAASISRAVMRHRSVALRPNSPKATKLPRCALPEILPLNCLRNLVRFGCIMMSPESTGCRWGGGFGGLRGIRFRLGGLRLRLIEYFALEYPHLDADHSVRGLRF